ncbi:MAG: HIT family protein [Arenicellales bacterium]|nr:HIT family protein [Arenicellales bacterium]
MNETIKKFGYPKNVLSEYEHWVVLLRPKQVTAGSLVLACKEPATSFSEVSVSAYSELAQVTKAMENALKRSVEYEKINYLALMMVDKEVHFHVLPRYQGVRRIVGVTFTDEAWPKPADITNVTELTDQEFKQLHAFIKNHWDN